MLADHGLRVRRDLHLILLSQVLDLGEQRLGDRSRPDPDRLEALHGRKHLSDIGGRGAGRGGDLRIAIGQEAVRVERADHVVGHRMQMVGQQRVQVPGQVILEREAGLGPGDRIELVILVAQTGRSVAGQVVRAEAHLVAVRLGLARHAFGAVIAAHGPPADRAAR